MKASSVGLEVDVELTEEEVFELKQKNITGFLNFREVNENQIKKIPIKISYSLKQRELLEVTQNPRRVYFGNANEITFSINNEFYEILNERGSYGDRFLGSGKFIVHKTKVR